MAPVARELSSLCGVLEPLQTARSVDGQIEELRGTLDERASLPVILIGWSWGAWLGFMLAARHPRLVRKLILVASPPFEDGYASEIMPTRLARLGEQERAEALSLAKRLESPEGAAAESVLARFGALMAKADAFDPMPGGSEAAVVQPEVYRAVWPEASELRTNGALLALGRQIRCPVIAIHGDYDSHPAEGVRQPLSRVVRDLRFVLLEHCGHEPWRESRAAAGFYAALKAELD